MSHAAQPHLPSSERRLPLAARADIELKESRVRGERVWTAKDPVSLSYFHLTPEQHTVLLLLDAERSLAQVREEYMLRHPASRPSLAEVRRLAFELYDKGLAYSTRADQGAALADRARESRRRRLKAALQNPLYVQLPGFDPAPVLRLLAPVSRLLFCRAAVVAGVLLVFAGWLMLWVRREELLARLPQADHFASLQGLLLLWAVIGAAKLLHEFGHALACKRLGGECHEIGVALLVFSPCLYCDVSDAAMFRSRGRRLLVGAAGIYVEVVLSAVAAILWVSLSPGVLSDVCLALFLVTNVSTILFNLNPLLRYDGYYLLCDLTDTPNLRQRAAGAVHRALARLVLGIEPPPHAGEPQDSQSWLLLYGVASGLYRWFFLAMISLVVYRTLSPYGLGAVGWLTGLTAAGVSLAGSGKRLWGFLVHHREDLGESARPRMAAAMGLIACLFFFLVPLPLRVAAPCYLQSSGASHVYVAAPGRLDKLCVAPGQRVSAGQVLAVLSDYAARDRYHALRTEAEKQRINLVVHQTTGAAAAEAVARESYRAVYQQGLDQHDQLQRLRITAPCHGVVVGPSAKRPAPSEARSAALPEWTGSPLDPENLGAQLTAGTHLLSVAPCDKFEAVLRIDQTTRSEFREGGRVSIKLASHAHKVLHGTIEEITRRTEDRDGSPLAPDTPSTVLSAERSQPAVFLARVALEQRTPAAVAGAGGVAKTWVTHRTPAEWVWRELRLTFSLSP